jgi:hypothetical protein
MLYCFLYVDMKPQGIYTQARYALLFPGPWNGHCDCRYLNRATEGMYRMQSANAHTHIRLYSCFWLDDSDLTTTSSDPAERLPSGTSHDNDICASPV